jgi:hypothetical protein
VGISLVRNHFEDLKHKESCRNDQAYANRHVEFENDEIFEILLLELKIGQSPSERVVNPHAEERV